MSTSSLHHHFSPSIIPPLSSFPFRCPFRSQTLFESQDCGTPLLPFGRSQVYADLPVFFQSAFNKILRKAIEKRSYHLSLKFPAYNKFLHKPVHTIIAKPVYCCNCPVFMAYNEGLCAIPNGKVLQKYMNIVLPD